VNGQYIDYEISYELPSDLDNANIAASSAAVVVRLSYDTSEKTAYGSVVYEQNGTMNTLGTSSSPTSSSTNDNQPSG
jgi:hypothetical protein